MGKKDKEKSKKKDKDKKKKKKKKNEELVEQTLVADQETVDESETILDHIQPSFVEAGARGVRPGQLAAVIDQQDELSQRFGADRTLGRHRDEAMLMLSLLQDFQSGQYPNVSYWSVAVMTFTFQYVLKPVDIIPDTLPEIGQLDDSRVIELCLEMVKPELLDYKVQMLAREEG